MDGAPTPPGGDEHAGQKPGKSGGGRGPLVLKWGRRRMRPARVEWATGEHSLAELLAGARAEAAELVRLFHIGPRLGGRSGDPAGFHAWTRAVPDGWTADTHYLHDLMAPVLRYRGPLGQRVEILRAATWFGESPPDSLPTPQECAGAFKLLGEELWESKRSQVLRTPTATGRHHLQQSIPDGVEWPVLDQEVQQLIRSTSGQGRFEVFTGPATLDGLTKVDMRFAYAAVGRELGSGPVLHRQYPAPRSIGDVWPDDERRYWPARYRVVGAVPRGWSHIGLLPVMSGDASWAWPAKGGQKLDTWVDGAELHVAVKAGWAPKVAEVLAFAPTPGAGPLGGWMDQLRRIRERVDNGTAEGSLAAAAVRSILLHTVGALHGTPHRVSRSGPADTVPVEELRAAPELIDGLAHWTAHLDQAWPEMAHPEWSSRIWGKTRARIAARMLQLPRKDIVAVQLDAIYLAQDPGWVDDGKVGTLRRQWTQAGPHDRPRNLGQLHRLAAS